MKITGVIKNCFVLLTIISLIIVLISCENKKQEIVRSAKYNELMWFRNDTNFANKKSYQTKFLKEFDHLLETKKYEDAKLLLYNYNLVIYNRNIIDTLLLNKNIAFFKKKYPIKKDEIHCMLTYYTANQYSIKNDPKTCIFYLNETIKDNTIAQSSNVGRLALHYLGMSYTDMFQYQKALESYTKVLKLHEAAKDYVNVGSVYYSMGNINVSLNALTEAENFFKKAAENFKKANDLPYYYLAQATYADGRYNNDKDTLGTIQFIDKIVTEFKTFKGAVAQDSVQIYNMKCLKYLLTKSYDSAFFYNNKSLTYYKKNNNDFDVILNQQLDNEIYFRKYKKLKNESELKKMAKNYFESKSYTSSESVYSILYQNAKIKNNLNDAIFYRNRQIQSNDSILKQNIKGQLFEIEKKYEFEKREKKIAQQAASISQNNVVIISLTSFLIIATLIIVVYFSRKKKLEAQAYNKQQEQFTFQLLQNTEEERSRIAGELHDSVNHDLLNIKNNLLNGKEIIADEVANVIEEVRNISRNLHPSVLENLGFEAGIENLCDRVSDAGLFTTCDITYFHKLSKNKELQLYRIIQEALNNTLKHGKANAAKVILKSEENYLELEIKDNGGGFDVQKEMQNPKSFGLQSIIQRAKAITAKININSSNKGTIILINIPV